MEIIIGAVIIGFIIGYVRNYLKLKKERDRFNTEVLKQQKEYIDFWNRA